MSSLPRFLVSDEPANLSAVHGAGHFRAQNVSPHNILHATGGAFDDRPAAPPAAPPAADVAWRVCVPLGLIEYQTSRGLPTTWIMCPPGMTATLAMEAL